MVKQTTKISPDDLRAEETKLAVAEQDIGMDLADIYVNPGAALVGMGKFMRDNSPEALVKKIESFPNYFGAMRAHMFEKNFLTAKGIDERAKAKTMAKDLPAKIKDYHLQERRVEAMRRATNGDGIQFPSGLRKDGPEIK